MCEGRSIFVLEEAYYKKKKVVFWARREKKKAIFECQLRKCVLPCKEKKLQSRGLELFI